MKRFLLKAEMHYVHPGVLLAVNFRCLVSMNNKKMCELDLQFATSGVLLKIDRHKFNA